MRRFVAGMLLSGALWWATTPPGHGVERCSLIVITGERSAEVTYLTAAGIEDTVLAGSGGVIFRDGRGGSVPPGANISVYGQRAMIGRYGGLGGATLDSVFQARSDHGIVLVPWDYDAACRTMLWTHGTQWIPSDTASFLKVQLRPRDHWVDVAPTFDVFTAGPESYPGGFHYRRMSELPPPDAWTADEYFDVYAALPTDCDWVRRPAQTARRANDLLEAEAERLNRFPGLGIASHLRRMIDGRANMPPNNDGRCRP